MLRAIIHYFRQCWCEHDFEVEEFDQLTRYGKKVDELVYMRCTKCGYNIRHRKMGGV